MTKELRTTIAERLIDVRNNLITQVPREEIYPTHRLFQCLISKAVHFEEGVLETPAQSMSREDADLQEAMGRG